jgi:hypothetical protein
MLHVTNGDSAAQRLRAAGLPGDVLAWRDVLHEGPVPAGLDEARLRAARARFIAALGWGDEARVLADMRARDERLGRALAAGEEIVLWFETDLYDVLQLCQVLDRFPPDRARLVLAGELEFTGVSELTAGELRELFEGGSGPRARSIGLDATVVAAARALWDAFRAPDPDGLAPLADGTPALPALGEAARRHLQQFPWRGTGLNRTERALLEAVAGGAETPVEAFAAQQRSEERPFMGDAIVFEYLRALAGGRDPLLQDGVTLRLRANGRTVMAGEREWHGRPERWLGGVELPAGAPRPRYEPATGRLSS